MNGPDLHDPISLPHTVTGYLIDSLTTVGGNGGVLHTMPRVQDEVQRQASPPPWIWDTVTSSCLPLLFLYNGRVSKTPTVDNEPTQALMDVCSRYAWLGIGQVRQGYHAHLPSRAFYAQP